jgi:hypothetical protein
VIEQHQLTVSEMAALLTVKGTNVEGQDAVQPRLARWADGPRRIVILEIGDADAEAEGEAFIATMKAFMSRVCTHIGH